MTDYADQPTFASPPQAEISATPMFFAEANLGIATAGGVARITLGSLILNAEPGAEVPVIKPVVTLAIPEAALLHLANEIIARAGQLGLDGDSSSQ